MNRQGRRRLKSTDREEYVRQLERDNLQLRRQIQERPPVDAQQLDLRIRAIEDQAADQVWDLAMQTTAQIVETKYAPFWIAAMDVSNLIAVIDAIATIPSAPMKRGMLRGLDERLHTALYQLLSAAETITDNPDRLASIASDAQARITGVRRLVNELDNGETLTETIHQTGGSYPRMLMETLTAHKPGRPQKSSGWRLWIAREWAAVEADHPDIDAEDVQRQIVDRLQAIPAEKRTGRDKTALERLEGSGNIREFRRNLRRDFKEVFEAAR